MADPVVSPPTGWRANPVLVRLLSVHTLLALLAIAFFICSHIPKLAGVADVLNAIGLLFGATAWQAAQEWLSPQVRSKLATHGAKAPTPPNGVSALPIVFLALIVTGLSACGGTLPNAPKPDPAVYTADFKACLINEGVQQGTPEAVKIFQILDQGGNSATQIEQKIENVALTVTSDVAIICIDCAVIAWNESNPVAAGAKPSPSQAAVRIYLAKHMNHPAVTRQIAKEPGR